MVDRLSTGFLGVQRGLDIPWQDIVAMRHRLIYAYFDIDLDIVWSPVTGDLQPLAG